MNQQLFDSIEAIVREAGRIVKNAHAGNDQIEKKEGLANFVTEYDVKVQEYLIGEFQKLIPGAAYFGEEATDGNKQQASADGYTFYIDPIDGTTNFIRKIPPYTISIAYMKGGQPRAAHVGAGQKEVAAECKGRIRERFLVVGRGAKAHKSLGKAVVRHVDGRAVQEGAAALVGGEHFICQRGIDRSRAGLTILHIRD